MTTLSDKTVGKLVSLATLSMGIAVGFVGGSMYRPQQKVEAQIVLPQTPTFQDVTPGLTTGTIGVNMLLAHEIATDHVVINGYDLMLMQQNILNYLGNRPLAEKADIQNIVNASRASIIYRLKQPQAPAPTPAIPEKKP